ncbi:MULTISPECIES: error-prone DNA polymerase [unclassified Undibacterium]|uniref:error-prone DNA polymerase n=1 Tax=unclassified Undibacterium TaxID=2630295 RepID=UPI002AC9CD24|nr:MULTISPECIES: error-prone DNA polymerase [unclassified Undibacterium]MEB0141129.1 error-prone DNA polymerase [Undibacterium sp. CCC2.1]MEB0174146.1 error-prone DNA polymerase [Undibacterium sp. CCC1.1]MEB0178088.1 error-prone DNA polymerase [Undibacterium sp. CCC3.4]MEB0217303.1 error-prone DNA polymerase [Undibacterium sp. 5I2]WPX43022.1 error-prone DNA polymerase [Undibacterium sp. CCC3.4]
MTADSDSTRLPDYAELFCLSNFTFLHGASHPEELVQRAAQLDYRALAITDECSLAGVVRAHDEAKLQGLPYILGSHFKLSAPQGTLTLLALACNREGYGNLSELITLARSRCGKGSYLLTPEDFTMPPPDYAHLRGLPDCLLILVPAYPLQAELLAVQAAWLAHSFGPRARLGLTLLMQAADAFQEQHIEHIAERYGLAVVALGQVCMHLRSRKPLQDSLTAIRLGTPVEQCGYQLAANAEQHLRSRLRLANLYPPAALAESLVVAALCHFSLDELRYEYPQEVVPDGLTAATHLRHEVYRGAQRRYPHGVADEITRQIEHELDIINDLAYEAYFLTVHDIVRFARHRGILCQGRGSAANSVVCYCLHITEVDPSVQTLLFERFISRERGEPPDIDVDFEHQRREEVIQYIYQKYGHHRAALTAAIHTYRPRGAVREVGKALGVDAAIIEAVAKSLHWFDSTADLLTQMASCGVDSESRLARQWAALATQLLRFPRHLSQHSGGFVIARGKLSRLVPIENAAMKDRRVIQWDKDDLESLGILKIDILALGMLSALQRALTLMAGLPGKPRSMQAIPREDAATYAMICRADTVGVFQIESRAQMSMLPRLRPQKFYDLVVQVAIVRPGPIQGGMVHPYLRRRQGLEAIETQHDPAMQKALGRTLGVPIFQEQVMQIAMLAANFTAGEADGLRRAMAAWKRKGGLDSYRERIIDGMLANQYSRAFAEGIFEQMKGFGEYGFPESHSASFAILAYLSSWIKCHEPAVFLCALLNSQPMGFYLPAQLIQDARRHQVQVDAIDVLCSEWDSSLENTATGSPSVRLGLSLLSGMPATSARRIMVARQSGTFSDVADLARRAELTRHDLHILAAGNALKSLAGHRRQALWQAVGALPERDLLRPTTIEEALPQLSAPSLADEIAHDYRTQGLSLQGHPLSLLRPQLLAQRFLPAELLNTFANGQFARGCGIITMRQRPGTANGVIFITLEDETGSINVIIWPSLFEQERRLILSARLLGVYGIWQCENEVRHLIAKRLVDLSHLLG